MIKINISYKQNQSGSISIILGVVILMLVAGGGAYYIKIQRSNPQIQMDFRSPLPSVHFKTTPSPTPQETAVNQKETSWKNYSGKNYTFSYPPDWELTGPDEYLDTVALSNPNKTVFLKISKGQYPYGFAGEMEFKQKNIAISIDGKTVDTKEIIENNTKAYVDFSVGDCNILYGTGYPAGDDSKPSLSDYNSEKETIAQILQSFKFTK